MIPEFISSGRGFEQAATASEHTVVPALSKVWVPGVFLLTCFLKQPSLKDLLFLNFVLLLTAAFESSLPLKCMFQNSGILDHYWAQKYMEAVSGQTDAVVLCFLVFLDLIASFLVLMITTKSKLLCLSSSICLFLSELLLLLAVLGLAAHTSAELWAGGSCRGWWWQGWQLYLHCMMLSTGHSR